MKGGSAYVSNTERLACEFFVANNCAKTAKMISIKLNMIILIYMPFVLTGYHQIQLFRAIAQISILHIREVYRALKIHVMICCAMAHVAAW
jgi:hypothetical protein